jgi:hypothetical protein
MANKMSMPRGSWSQLKKIVRAYGAVHDAEKPTVEDVAKLAGLARSVVSGNNEFLRELEILSKEENKLMPLGTKLAHSLQLENDGLVAEALQEIVRANPTLNQWIAMVRARGQVKRDFLEGTIALAVGITEKNKQVVPVNAILELLQESQLIELTDDAAKAPSVSVLNSHLGLESTENRAQEIKRESVSIRDANAATSEQRKSGIPFALGPSRLVHVQLPEDWNGPKDLPRLLKLMQIALGESEEP